jgi:hypothetical protein
MVGAALLVLLGLGLFVAGILTGVTALYWSCVAACVVAAVLLVLARRKLGATSPTTPADAGSPERPAQPPARAPVATPPAGAAAVPAATGPAVAPEELADPPVEEVEVNDLLLVVDLEDEVLVIDEHPRYHLAGCVHVAGRTTIPLPLDEARTDGFTPCAVCAPDRNLAERARARKAGGA